MVYKEIAEQITTAARKMYTQEFLNNDNEAKEAARECFRKKCSGEDFQQELEFLEARWQKFLQEKKGETV